MTWFSSLKSASITLDIGRCRGLQLLTVLLIDDETGNTKLAGFELTADKDGDSCAKIVYRILDDKIKIPHEQLNKIISGVVGDGAFIKGNEPFKAKMCELIGKPLLFRWDILHLVNRSHIKARDESKPVNKCHTLPQLMNFVQSESVEWRSGADFTRITIETLGAFKRPKLYSETRLVNYEFNQLQRFVECCKYWDIPDWVLIAAKLYLPVTYVIHLILQRVQATTIKTEYIFRVFQGDNPEGKAAMILALDIAECAINQQTFDHLLLDQLPEVVKTKKTGENQFKKDIEAFMKKNKEYYTVQEVAGIPRTRGEVITVNTVRDTVTMIKAYIGILWAEIADRFVQFDLTGSTCWSEAPAESVFSTWGTILDHRQSLSVKHAEMLCRVVRDGPKTATRESEIFMTKISSKYKDGFGLRFATKDWQPGFISNVVQKIQEGIPWEHKESKTDETD